MTISAIMGNRGDPIDVPKICLDGIKGKKR